MHRINRDVTQRKILVEIALSRDIAAATLEAHFNIQGSTFTERGDVQSWIEHLNIGIRLNVPGRNLGGPRPGDRQGLRLAAVKLEGHLLKIQDHVSRVFDYAFDRREFMFDSFDFYCGDRCAFDRRKQGASQRITYRRAKTALERLRRKSSVACG